MQTNNRITSIFSRCLLIVLLSISGACWKNIETPPPSLEKSMSVDEYPLTQGSNPTRIISESIFSYFTGLDDTKDDYYRIVHTGTSPAYSEFLEENSKIDMIIAQQPDPTTEQLMQQYFFKPIAKDALVFITNIDNPLDSLELTQIKDILSGKITNWQELGGNDEPITLFIRDEMGGSQILLDKYVLKGTSLRPLKGKSIANDMREMSKYVGEQYQNGCTFGYTTYYFAAYSGKRDDIKMIKVNGISADYDSIKNDLYPIVAMIYIGVKEMDSPAGIIFQWILTEEGQKVIDSTGYIPLFPGGNKGCTVGC